jgi:8-oxo-dGTP pyrophosphatase MutT (NUDIX family)
MEALRALIEERLQRSRPEVDPQERILANVVGAVSPELRHAIESSRRQAAVLVALIERPAGMSVLFTQRASHLKHHPGQISFPGGRLEDPAETVVAAALREAHEEIGLESAAVSVAGCLDPHVTGTGFSVTPVVGFVADTFVARPDPAEVSAVFEVPLEWLLEPDTIQVTYRERLGSRFRTFEFHYAERVIWGATAAIVVTFRDLLHHEESVG